MSERQEQQQRAPEPIAIIGMGCLFPKANSLRAYWANIKNAVDAISEVPASHWRPEDYFDADPKRSDFTYGRRGGFLDPIDFDPLEFGMPPATLEATDTSQLLGMLAADRALRDAGYGPDSTFDRDRVSVILGVTGALELVIPLGARLGHPLWRQALLEAGIDADTVEDAVQRIGDAYVPWQEASFPGLLGNVVAGRITKHLNLGGTNCVVDAACASSLSAINLATLELAAGRSDMVITGGVDTFNDIFMYMCFSKTPALSPSGHAKPFDVSADGTTLGEGLGILVLKRLSDAERDGDRVYACIRGMGASSDGKGDAIYAPSAKGQTKALRRAYEQAQVAPESIELVEAHGTGTAAGDAAEITALQEVYGASPNGAWCALGSVKSQIGHTKAAAGAAGVIKAALALYHKVLPPTIKVQQPQAALTRENTPFYVNTDKRPWVRSRHPRRAAVSALGFGGSNFHCVLEEYSALKTAPDWNGDIEILAFSAETTEALRQSLLAFPGAAVWDEVQREAQQLRQHFTPSAKYRLVLVARADQDVSKIMSEAAQALKERSHESAIPRCGWSLPSGVHFGAGPPPGKLALVFSGQGAQQPGMLRDLVCTFPEMFESLELAEAIFEQQTGEGLHGFIHPQPAFSKEARASQEEVLRNTAVAQPALGAVEAGAIKLLRRFGLHPDAYAGHSYGELAALHAAGCYDESTLFRLSCARGELMAHGDSGTGMLAVRAGVAQVESMLRESGLHLTIANKNAPEQTVLSGPKSALEQAAALFKARNLSATTLPVAAAFHSEHVSAASAPFLLVLREAAIGAPGAPVYANTSAAPYPQDIDALREQLAAQLARPVEFIAQVERMHADGVRTFVEVGPGARITGLIQAILQGRDFTAAALDTTSAKRCGIESLARLLAQLAALGYPVLLEAWNADVAEAAPRKKPRMTVKLCGANYVSPRKESRPARNRPAPSTTATAGPASQTGKIGKTQPQAQDHHAGVTMNQETSQKRPANSGSPPVPASDSQDGHPNGEILMALQRLQEQTAQLHRQFLEGQQAALATFQMLLKQPAGARPPAASDHRRDDKDSTDAGWRPQAAKLEGGATRATIASEDSKPADASKAISELLLRTVAEKTGYPVEMLELGMSLDADLGIDSIKRVEILSSFREQMPEAPEIGADQVGRLQTLQQIVEFIAGSRDQKDERDRKDQRDDGDSQAIGNLLLLVVAEKTGYPAEMLELGMSLDADLGIDSIKRVEILSGFRELMPDAPEVGPEQVGQLQTLQQIVDFIAGNKGATDSRDNSDRKDPKESNAISGLLLSTVAEKTGYPAEMLELEMSLDADLGIDSIKRVEILSALQEKLPGAPQPGPEMVGKLQTLADIVAFLAQGETTAEAPAPPAEARPPEISRSMRTVERMVLTSALLEEQPVKAVSVSAAPVWITDDSGGLAQTLQTVLAAQGWRPEIVTLTETPQPPECLAGAILLAPAEGADDQFLYNTFIFAQTTAPALRRASQDAPSFFVTVSRLDGCFGYRPEASIRDVVSGGLAGLAKTAHHEWPEVQCRALDFAPEFDAAAAAERIAQELLGGGPREVGLAPEGRLWLQLSPVPAGLLNGLRPLQPGDPVVITGGARGVTAEVAVALAQRFQPTLILLGRSALKEEPAWLAPLRDEAGIKRALMEHGVNTPRELSQQTAALLANREIHANIVRMQAAGSRVSYHSVDIRDSATVAAIVQDVRAQYGPIRGVVHGAGVIADKLIQDKTSEQFRNVYSTKVEGLRTLLEAVSGDPLRVLVLFSSSTGRYGRRGQVDYAMANEVLNKLAHVEQRNRPECRVVAVNWGPWEGGMVTPALKKVFEEEGVGLIDLEVGARYLIQEISQDKDRAAEVVVFGFPAPKKDTAAQEPAAQHPAAAGPPLSLAFAIDLNTEDHSFLCSHVLKGHAVLPVVMMIEWFSQAALHTNPGLRFHGLNNLRVFKGVKLDDGERLKLSFLSGKAQHQDGLYVVPVELRSTRAEATDVVHASAEVLLAAQPLEGHVELVVDGPCDKMLPEGEYYTNGNLFHGPHFQGLSEASFSHGELMRALVQAAPAPAQWIARPLRNSWITDPLALDCALQLTILWTFEHYGVASLPGRIQEYRQFRAYPRRPMRVTARMTQHNEHHATADIEFTERESGLLIARLRGYECTLDRSLNEVFKQNALA